MRLLIEYRTLPEFALLYFCYIGWNYLVNIMKIKLLSDLHNEFGLFELNLDEHSKDTVLVLAGDIDVWGRNKERYIKFLEDVSKGFYHVVFIAGNHEFYDNGDITRDCDDMKGWSNGYDNIHFLENNHVEIDDVVFIGTTLWTDMNKGNIEVANVAKCGMNDFRQIYIHGELFSPMVWMALNAFARGYIIRVLEKFINKTCVVITHHAPSEKSLSTIYRGAGSINFAYINTLLDCVIDKFQPAFWFHGHTHVSFDYNIGETRVVCNPRGYCGYEENPKFDPTMILEL